MDGLTIRAGKSGDERGIAAVHVASWRAAYSQILGADKMAQLSVDEREQAWRERLTALPEGHTLRTLVAELDGEVVGFSTTQATPDDDLDPDTVAELTALYLVPEVWRRGVGSRLLAEALDVARRQGFTRASLWVLEGNAEAIAFYEKKGWAFDNRAESFKDFGVPALRYVRQFD